MTRIIIFAFVLAFAKTGMAQTIIYTCPMHPQIQRSQPGNCPICGMTLVKKTIRAPKPKPKPVAQPKTDTLGQPQPVLKKDTVRSELPKADSIDEQIIYPGERIDLSAGHTVRYDLYVRDSMVNYSGKLKPALVINGQLPAPTLYFTEGDTAEIYLHNELQTATTSLHWHGVILPNPQDGVPFLTTSPVQPGETHLYRFAVVQNGTYWYHSHSGLQEQAGLYGVLVFRKRPQASLNTPSHEFPLILSEWTDEKPRQVQRRLRSANDWYAIKKGSVQSYAEAIKAGHFRTKLLNEWKRMRAMDVSDVYYDKFLSNGKPESEAPQFREGEKVRLRVVNAGASSYFWLQYGGGKMTVVANDGNDVDPVEVDRLIIGVSETYDVEVTIPGNHSYEFRSTPEDRTKATSLWLGSGAKVYAPVLPRLKYFEGMKMMNDMMKMNGEMDDMGMKMGNQAMDMNTVMYSELVDSSFEIKTLNYDMLRSPFRTSSPDWPTRTLHFSLTGNMNRYVWTLDNKTISESDKILIRQGENVKIILTNNSMMRHPMHLHGHDFRVLNAQGEYSPLKNVLDIMPMETDSIEIAANKEGDWFFHCHILYHMMAGMGRVFRYSDSPVNPELPDLEKAWKEFKKDNRMSHLMARIGIESNGSDAEFMINADRYALQGLWHLGYMPTMGYEFELNLGRFLGPMQWMFPYVGFDYHYKKTDEKEKTLFGQASNKNDRKTFVAGIQYTLPMLFVADARIDGKGRFRFQLGREDLPLTSRARLNFMANSDREYMIGARYILRKWLAISTHYDSDMGWGAGVTLSY